MSKCSFCGMDLTAPSDFSVLHDCKQEQIDQLTERVKELEEWVDNERTHRLEQMER